MSSGRQLIQIATDAGLLGAPVARSSIHLASGERVEVVVDFAAYALGDKVVLRNLRGSGRTADPLRFDVERAEADPASVPAALASFSPIAAGTAVRSQRWTLGMGMMGSTFTINGKTYDYTRTDASARLGDMEIWEYVNPTGVDHPMHAHGIRWQILDRKGVPPAAYETGWKDTWLVPSQGRLRVIGRFTDYACDPNPLAYTSHYTLHCHILEHEDRGMMEQLKTISP